jgi:hypothetical protein
MVAPAIGANPASGATMVEYTWQKRKVSDRSSRWNAQNAKNGIIQRRKTVVTIRDGWS